MKTWVLFSMVLLPVASCASTQPARQETTAVDISELETRREELLGLHLIVFDAAHPLVGEDAGSIAQARSLVVELQLESLMDSTAALIELFRLRIQMKCSDDRELITESTKRQLFSVRAAIGRANTDLKVEVDRLGGARSFVADAVNRAAEIAQELDKIITKLSAALPRAPKKAAG